MFKSKIILIMFTLVASTACGKFTVLDNVKEAGSSSLSLKPFGTCDRKNVATFNMCMEAIGTDYDEPNYLDILQSSCVATGGAFSTNNCDTTGALGSCVVAAGQSNETRAIYFAPEFNASTAQGNCLANGGIYKAF